VAGIAEHYTPESLIGRQIIVVANLKPAKLMGVLSQGMLLAAGDAAGPVLVQPDRTVPPGTPCDKGVHFSPARFLHHS
jgi:methionyl-tRNA synthetase